MPLFQKYQVPLHIQVLSVDIDYNDFYCLKEILAVYMCDIIICEYNASHLPHEDKVAVYGPQRRWDGTNYFGVSLLALNKLATLYNYSLVCCDQRGVNAFFVRDELLDQRGVALEHRGNVVQLYRPPRYGRNPKGGHRDDPLNRAYVTFDEALLV